MVPVVLSDTKSFKLHPRIQEHTFDKSWFCDMIYTGDEIVRQ